MPSFPSLVKGDEIFKSVFSSSLSFQPTKVRRHDSATFLGTVVYFHLAISNSSCKVIPYYGLKSTLLSLFFTLSLFLRCE